MTSITRSDNLYCIDPFPAGLEHELTYTRREREQVFGKGVKYNFITEALYSEKDGKAYFPSGLIHRVTDWLTNRNMEFKVTDYRDIKKLYPEPDFSKVDRLREGQDKLLLSVAANDGGLILSGTGSGKSFILKQICKMYPTLSIVITSARVSVIQTIYQDLMKAGIDVGQAGGGANDTDHRVVVSTTKSLKKANIQGCDLFLFDEVHNVGYNEVADTVAYVARARKFGFTATATGRSDGAEMVMEALFGPVLAEIPYYDAVDMGLVMNIDVQMYRVLGGHVPETKSDVVRRRWGYWRHAERNKAIASVANSIPKDEQVLIMVETLEHAIYLHQLLPDFKVVHYGNVAHEKKIAGVMNTDYKMRPSETKALREQFEAGTLKRVISTLTWREGVNFINLSCLIRGDGSSSPISSAQIPGRLSRIAEGKDKAVLIDFLDEFDEWALRRSKQRVSLYRKQKWNITQRTLPA